ncbi:hypothetical protein V2G26_018517 [Clonostachys chloroleuca]
MCRCDQRASVPDKDNLEIDRGATAKPNNFQLTLLFLKFIVLSLSILISQALAINVILFAKGPKMPKEVTKEWAIPAHSCDKPEKTIVEKMGSWSKNKYTAQMGTGQNARVVVKPTKEPDTEAAAIQMLGDMESILAKNTKKGWCEKLVDKFKGVKKTPRRPRGSGWLCASELPEPDEREKPDEATGPNEARKVTRWMRETVDIVSLRVR